MINLRYTLIIIILLLFITQHSTVGQDQWVQSDWSNNQYTSFENLDPIASPGELILLNDPSNMVFSFILTNFKGIWDLIIYDDKLFIAASTSPFVEDGGEILSFDFESDNLDLEYVITEKGVIQFRKMNNQLYVPGTYSGSDDWGNFYVYNGASWIVKSTLPDAVNVYDLIFYQDAMYASTSTSDNLSAKIFKSTNEGDTWAEVYNIATSGTGQRNLYMMGIFQDTLFVQSDLEEPEGKVLYQFDGNNWSVNQFSSMVSSIGSLQQYDNKFYFLNGPYMHIYNSLEWLSIDLPFSGWMYDPVNTDKRIQKSLSFYKNEIYSGGEGGQLYRSENGELWNPISNLGSATEEIEAIEIYHGRIYVGVNDSTSTGKVYVSSSVPSGILISEKYNFVKLIEAGSITWDVLLPDATSSVRFQIRTANTQNGLEMKQFTGPDGTQQSFYETSGQSLHESLFDKNWIQYKVFMTSVNNAYTPVLQEVTISAFTYTNISSNIMMHADWEIYPNPCSDFTNLRFKISDQGVVICDLYEASGNKLKQLINEEKVPGIYEIKIDLSDVPAGIYFCTLKTNNPEYSGQTKKMIKL